MAKPIIERFVEYCIAELIRRFESKYTPEPNSGCWLWLGFSDGKGYGRLELMGRPHLAHRVGYELFKGPIPDGLVLDHLCKNPFCVNPDHLEPVTMGENTRRGRSGECSRLRRLAQTHCKLGHPLSGPNLYINPTSGQRVCRTCLINRKRKFRAKTPSKGPNLDGLKLGGAANGARLLAQTHCKNGHPWDTENTRINASNGQRVCRACCRERERMRRSTC
jgi:hypothetical protein